MKKIVITIAFAVISILTIAQNKIYKDAQWDIGETKEIEGTLVKRVEGENKPTSITNVSYQTQKQLIDQLKENKKNGTIGGDAYKRELSRFTEHCAGGLVQLFVTRPTEENTNPVNFHLDLKKDDGTIIFQKDYKEEKVYDAKNGTESFKCTSLAFIKTEAFLPLTIEITEKFEGKTTKFVFEVPKPE